ncbi:uncharacterized protein LOC134719619 [Mytilus trossulus]|uniref:uncharacterized protein LOC134719619 n=1 Tax=Mytilus trossulus TaxID=6551 RepID=UPI003007BD10
MDRTKLVVAFNIGEIYTGYTFSTTAQFNDDPMKINSISWHSQYNRMSEQTPSSIILNAEKGFQSFGFEAEDQYLLSCENNKDTNFYFFQHFLCQTNWFTEKNGEIYVNPLNRVGPVLLQTLIRHSVSYLKTHFLNEIQKSQIADDNILWVVVYPELDKFDVRLIFLEAFLNTGIDRDNILLVGESLAIQAFARYIEPSGNYETSGIQNKSTIILNCAKTQICPNISFQKHLQVATNVIGMSSVVDDIDSIMKKRIGCSIFTGLTDINSRCDVLCWLEIALEGSVFRQAHGSHVGIKIPSHLIEYMRKHVTRFSNDGFKLQFGVLRIEIAVIHEVFQNALSPLMDHLKREINIFNTGTIQNVILVGDFSKFIMTKTVFRESYPQFEIIVPSNSYMAATIGATLAGHEILSGKKHSRILYIPKMSIVGMLHIKQAALKSSSNFRTSINDKPAVKLSIDTGTTTNVSYLPDLIRPSKIATKLQDLYESDYADILEAIVGKGRDNSKSEEFLLQILHVAYDECRKQAHAQINTITQALHPTCGIDGIETSLPSDVVKPLIEYRRKNALQYLPRLIKSFVETLPNMVDISNAQLLDCTSFIEKSIECCWLMCVTEPPMFLKFEWNKSEQIDLDQLDIEGGDGRNVDSMRWPPLYLHENGPLMNKGVVNAK